MRARPAGSREDWARSCGGTPLSGPPEPLAMGLERLGVPAPGWCLFTASTGTRRRLRTPCCSFPPAPPFTGRVLPVGTAPHPLTSLQRAPAARSMTTPGDVLDLEHR